MSLVGKVCRVVTVATISTGILYTVIKQFCKKKSNQKDIPKRWVRVGSVSKLIIYPIKSCTGIEVEEATVTPIGLRGPESEAQRDRIFMVVDHRYSFQTQRVLPRLALIKVLVKGEQVTVSGPRMESLTISLPENILPNKRSCRVFEDHVREVLDCGDKIGHWLDTFLEVKGFRLVYHALQKTQRIRNRIEAQFPAFFDEDKAAFQDQTAFMLLSEESIADLNRLLKNPVTVKNFRPSILISGVPEPFAEDFWSYVQIGSKTGPIFKSSKPCTRCKLTTVNPETGEFDPEGQPLETLEGMNRSVGNDVVDKLVKGRGLFGLSMGFYQAGSCIKVGDPVYCALL